MGAQMCTHSGRPMGKKDVAFKIRVERDLRDQFIEACREHEISAAQVIRDYMKNYVSFNESWRQPSLFDDET